MEGDDESGGEFDVLCSSLPTPNALASKLSIDGHKGSERMGTAPSGRELFVYRLALSFVIPHRPCKSISWQRAVSVIDFHFLYEMVISDWHCN